MQELEARLTLSEIVPADRFSEFTSWLEAEPESCDHDAQSYEPWLLANDVDVSLAPKLYDAMQVLAPGPCRCAAAAELWPSDFHATLRGPVVWCRPEQLPASLIGEVAPDRAQQLGWFFAAHRGELGDFWDAVAEPPEHADWEDALGVLDLLCELVASDRELAWAGVSSGQSVESFYHGGDAAEVEAWLRERGHTLIPMESVLERLAVFVLTSPGGPVTDVLLEQDGSPALFYIGRPEIVVIRAAERSMWAEGWKDLAPGAARLLTSQGIAELPDQIEPGVHVLSVPKTP